MPGQPVEIGPFRVHPIRVAHSVLDSLALAIETPAGVVLASGDFKIDATAPRDERTDVEALSEWGDRGVLALLSDSTNVEHAGAHLRRGRPSCRPSSRSSSARAGACSSPASPRRSPASSAWPTWRVETGRPVAFLGRRMLDNAEVALDLGLLRLSEAARARRPATAHGAAAGDRAVVFVSGSQGEPLSALSMISVGEHRDVGAGPGDTVVLSARAIPGNERTVSRLISNLFRLGCDVVHPGTAKVHVSGHGSRERPRRAPAPRAAALPGARARRVPDARAARPARGRGRAPLRPGARRRGRGRPLPVRPRGPARDARGRRPRAPRPRGLRDRGRRGARPPAPVLRGHRGPDRGRRPPDRSARVPARDRHPRHRGCRRGGGAGRGGRTPPRRRPRPAGPSRSGSTRTSRASA